MKEFFKKYGYTAVKMLVYQVAFALFGWALATATIASGGGALTLVASIFSVLFYLVLNIFMRMIFCNIFSICIFKVSFAYTSKQTLRCRIASF